MKDNGYTYRVAGLILKRVNDDLDEAEKNELESWRNATDENQQLYDELMDEKKMSESVMMLEGLKKRIDEKVFSQISEAREVIILKKKWPFFRWAVAASVLLIVGLGSYFLLINYTTLRQSQDDRRQVKFENDVEAPKSTKAMITLGNGQKVYLDSISSGQLAVQQGVKIEKLADGKIVYHGSSSEVFYNTLTNPRGSKVIDLVLADNSHVWLNAGSSVTYPVAFVGNERKVSINGEAYFEVSPHPLKGGKKMPFIVNKGDMQVEVLGTHFNVNAYDDNEDIKITLLEGSVKVVLRSFSSDQDRLAESDKVQILKPGQQAQIAKDLKVFDNIDLDQVMAWKNGYFSFKDADIKTVMQELSRWYDIDVRFEGKINNEQFTGKIGRDLNLRDLFEGLAETRVHYRIEDQRKVVIVP